MSDVAILSRGALDEARSAVKSERRLPSLDGLRGIAIGLVLISHGWPQLAIAVPAWLKTIVWLWGSLGVELFFSLSGFLITHLLCRELRSAGRIGLKAFYLRRALRILPPLFLFLGVLAGLDAAGVLAVPARQILAGIFFCKNYLLGNNLSDDSYVGHLWSLSLEEQFYLLLPFALGWLGTQRARKGVPVVLVLMPFLRIAWYFLLPFSAARSVLTWGIHSAVDRLLWGSLLALHQDAGGNLFPERLLRAPAAFLGAVGLFLVGIPFLEKAGGSVFLLVGGMSLRSACATFVIAWLLHNRESWPARLVNWRGLGLLGTISYSVYLWQQVFLGERNAWLVGRFPVALAACLAAAMFSYLVVEAPLLSFRRRLRPKATLEPAG